MLLGPQTASARFLRNLALDRLNSESRLCVRELVQKVTFFQKEMGRAANSRRSEFAEVDIVEPRAAGRTVDPEARDDNNEEEERVHARRSDLRITEEIGASLFDFLFGPEIERLFRDTMERSFADQEALPVRLLVEHVPQLSAIPWEALYDRKTRGFLALSRQTPLIRAVRRDPTKLSRPRQPTIRILGMIARPSNGPGFSFGHIDAEGEQLEMRRAMAQLEERKKVELHWTVSGRQADLEDAIIRPQSPLAWNIFHFIGHGGFDRDENRGYLVVQEEDGAEADLLYSDMLKGILIGPKQPQLVVLNSCQGAFASSADLFTSTAADLAVGGVPAVVAMQFVVSDEMAKAFTRKFYECLAKGELDWNRTGDHTNLSKDEEVSRMGRPGPVSWRR